MINITDHICTLTARQQEMVKTALCYKNINSNEIQIAMSGKLCDIEEVVDISQLMKELNSIKCEHDGICMNCKSHFNLGFMKPCCNCIWGREYNSDNNFECDVCITKEDQPK